MPEYSQSKIYQIKCDTTGLVYIGSTTQNLAKRIANHVSTFYGGYSQCSSQSVLENNNYRYSLIEEYSCDNKEQLHMREQFHIDQQTCVNKCRAFTTEEIKKEREKKWREDNRTQLLKGKRDYYNEDKQKWIDNSREWVLNNKERVQKNQSHWVEQNREHVAEYKKKWRARKRAQLALDSALASSGSVN